jgi:hypothetical protein
VSANSAGLAAAAQRDSDIRQWLESFDATCPNGPPPPRAPSIWDDAIDQALSVGEGGRVYDSISAADVSWLGAQGPIAERVNEAYAARDAAYERIADGWQNGDVGEIALGGLQALSSAFNFVTSPLTGTLDEGSMALGYSPERSQGISNSLLFLATLPFGGESAGAEGLTQLAESGGVEPLLTRNAAWSAAVEPHVPMAEGVFADMSGGAEDPLFTVFRGERSSVTPDIVFAKGFSPKGDNLDLLAHTSRSLPDSGFIATSPNFDIALHYAGRNGYVYELVPDGGIDVNAVLGDASPFPEQLEIAIPNGVSPANIRGAYPLSGGKLTGEFVYNPLFNPKR